MSEVLELSVGFIIGAVVVILILFAIVAFVVWKSAISYRIKVGEAKVGSAEEKAREIIDEALKTAETKKREAQLETKEESIRVKGGKSQGKK